MLQLPIPAFLGDANRCQIIRRDNASRPCSLEMRVPPFHRRANRFSRIPPAMRLRSQHPPDFRHTFQRWLYLALVIGKPNLSHKIPRLLFNHHPVSKPQHPPMPRVTEKLCPSLLFTQWLAANKSSYQWVRPHRGAISEIIEP